MIYLQLFWEFFKAGLFSIGGGMATIPFLEEISRRTGWFTIGQLADMIAVSESTPGPIGVNMATYTGNITAGVSGGIVATLGLITPSIIIILIISGVLSKFKSNKYVENAFYGLRPASVGLIGAAFISVLLITFFNAKEFNEVNFRSLDYKYIILAAILFVATRYIPQTKKLHPVIFIAFAAFIGIIFKF